MSIVESSSKSSRENIILYVCFNNILLQRIVGYVVGFAIYFILTFYNIFSPKAKTMHKVEI